MGVDCPGHRCGVSCSSSFPCVITSLLALRLPSSRIGFPSVCSSRLPGWASRFSIVLVAVVSLVGGWRLSFAWRFRSSLSIRAVFVSSISHLFPITIVVGGVRANRLTGHRERRTFHMGHREDGNRGTPREHETQDGERRMTRTKTPTEATGGRDTNDDDDDDNDDDERR